MLSNYIQIHFKRIILLSSLLLVIPMHKTRELEQVLRSQLSCKNIAIFTVPLIILLFYFPAIQNNYVVLAIPNVPTNNNTLTSLSTANHRPVSNAGINQTINENTTVMLNGIASDPDPGDYDKLTYLWKQIAGPVIELSNNTGTNPSFTAPIVSSDRELRFSLTAKDNKGAESKNSAIVTITVKHLNRSPLANAGANHTASPSDVVTLDGSKSKDPDDDPLTYSWMQTAGLRVRLDSVNTSIASFTVPSNISSDTDLIFRLTVEDSKNTTSTDDVKVTVKPARIPNKSPIANAGIDQTVNAGDTIKLNGTASRDPDRNNITSYLWNQIAGSPVTLNGADTAIPSFIAPSNISANTALVFQLTVIDDQNASSISPVRITIKPANHPPAVNAGINQTVNAGDVVTLDGSKSVDPDNDQIKYLWKQVAGTPAVTINGAGKPIAVFTAPKDISSDTDMIFELTVTDDKNATNSDTVKVTDKYILPPNALPVANPGMNQTVNSGDYITLDGTASNDPNGTIASYSWKQTDGLTVELYNTTNPTANFFAPTVSEDTTLNFSLAVTDDKGTTSPSDVVTITIKPAPGATTTTNMTTTDNMTVTGDVGDFNDKGDELYNQERYQEAIEWYDKALAIDPNYTRALNGKGNALLNLEKYQEAIEWYDKALAIDPNYTRAFYNKGNALNRLERYQEAIEYFDKALAIDPNYTRALNGKGNALLNLEKYQEAIEWYDKALAIDPNYTRALNGKGNALNGLEKYQEAIEWYDKALAIDPNNADVSSNKALALANLEGLIR
jgi:Flp pilus assembly protein TadD